MSTIRVPIVPITSLRAHSDPAIEKLEVAVVEGWQLCVPKGQYQAGDRVVYFEQGTVIPRTLADELGVTNYLSEKTDINGDKVLVIHRVKLRGEPSFGLAIPMPADFHDLPIGANVAYWYGATKFQPPLNTEAKDAEIDHPLFHKFTELENMRSFPTIFREGEPVVMTEKVDGVNCRVGFVIEDDDMIVMAGGRALRRRAPAPGDTESVYWYPLSVKGVNDLLLQLHESGHQQAIIYGEVYGSRSFGTGYGERIGFRAIDIMVDGQYLPYPRFISLCNLYQIEAVPMLYHGPFSMDAIAARSNGESLLNPKFKREGGVVRPAYEERQDPTIGRVILKYVGDDYLFSKTAMKHDTTDV